jgi:hypothetical protein
LPRKHESTKKRWFRVFVFSWLFVDVGLLESRRGRRDARSRPGCRGRADHHADRRRGCARSRSADAGELNRCDPCGTVEVDRYAPPEPTADAVDREIDAVRARFPSQAALEAALARSGIDERHLRETLRQDLRIRAYLGQRFNGTEDQRLALINEWVAGLRRRADVIDLYLPTPRN